MRASKREFQFTPVVRRATGHRSRGGATHHQFQFTPVVRRATGHLRDIFAVLRFNSRPSCDGRQMKEVCMGFYLSFQFTPVVRRATPLSAPSQPGALFQFTPVVRRATGSRG